MKKIVALIRPFDLEQAVYVFENGNKIDMITSPLDDINNSIFQLIDKYSLDEIELIGPKSYAKGIKNKFEEEELSKYNENKIKISIK